VGALTAVWGTLLAIRENDMKRLMAFSTVSNLGFIVFALSVNTFFGVAAAIFHTFNHMLFKSTIFLSMASVKFRTGEREMHRLGGIGYRMPVAFFAFLLGIIAAAGIPPMNGFASKWMVFQSLFENNLLILSIPAFLASTAAFLYLYRGLHSIYLGQLSPRFARIKAAPPLQMLVMGLMMLAVFAIGVFPGVFLLPINEAIVSSGGAAVEVTLSSIIGVTSEVNLTMVAAAFMGAFIIVMVLYMLGKRRSLVEPLDTYTAGETPEDWNMVPEQYHYAYNFYEPFEKMTGPLLERFSAERWFETAREQISRLSASIGRGLSVMKPGTMLITAGIVVILLLGIVLW
jgi:NADH-quinone oxidoreductase subunit M